MAEELAANPQPNEGNAPEAGSAVDMELGTSSSKIPGGSGPLAVENGAEKPGDEGGGGGVKRKREEGNDTVAEDKEEDEAGSSNKRMVERSLEEKSLDKMEDKKEGGEDSNADEKEEEEGGGGEEEKKSMKVCLGPKAFDSSKEMFDYFFKLLRQWSPNLDINEYEHMVLLDLLQKGHPEPEKKIGEGIQAFQVRYQPAWKSRCFFIVRVDGTDDDFSFRKCIDQILPLPEHMKAQSASNGNKVGRRKGGCGFGNQGGRSGGNGSRGCGRRGGK
ncbi:uncharacterized protein [Elaeis guineensis]|uniref:Protein EMBRYO DEFECTIVE 514 n=1 Tax=Elaeis guineensis var. tenera TaxID=51953 RepID=A0A6I9QX09_ELAGV|nr:protein EMBRYO DEFECTIVE 514 [Elaeis guineensis]